MSSDAAKPIRHIEGQVVVGSKIIDYLSSGLYNSPASCLKELVNNAYDADATMVNIYVRPDADYIMIEDDGSGLSADDFERHWQRITESHKRDDSEFTPILHRPKIGKIGIGFIAANELCDQMEIRSTRKGSDELLSVTLDFALMRSASQADRQTESEAIQKGDYKGHVEYGFDRDAHFTRIFLKNVTSQNRELFAGASSAGGIDQARSLYGLRDTDIPSLLTSLKSWSTLDEYSKTMIGVGLNVPVRYHENWIKPMNDRIVEIQDRIDSRDFKVVYDGTELRKPVILWPDPEKESMVESFDFDGDYVSFSGYFYAQHGQIEPSELRGALVRVREAAIGEYSDDFFGYPVSKIAVFSKWISAEIYADDRLEAALNIDRRTLRESHPAYVELKEAFHVLLAKFASKVRLELYQRPNNARLTAQREKEKESYDAAASKVSKLVSPAAREQVDFNLQSPSIAPTTRRSAPALTAAEVLDTVASVARDILPPPLVDKFLLELTARLGR